MGERLLMIRSNSPEHLHSLYTKVLEVYQFDYVFNIKKISSVRYVMLYKGKCGWIC